MVDKIVQGQDAGKSIVGITAYFDESGTHVGSPVLVVGGYVSTSEKWEYFNGAWAKFLEKECPGEKYFHAKDHILNVETPISKRAVKIIGRAVKCGGGVSMNPEDFEEFTTPKIRKTFGDAYQFCCQAMLETMIDLPEVRRLKGEITYIFERGAPHWEKFDKRMHRIEHNSELKARFRYKTHFFQTKTEAPPLQTADIVANLMFRTHRDNGRMADDCLHPVLYALAGQKPHFLQPFDRAEVQRTLQNTIL